MLRRVIAVSRVNSTLQGNFHFWNTRDRSGGLPWLRYSIRIGKGLTSRAAAVT